MCRACVVSCVYKDRHCDPCAGPWLSTAPAPGSSPPDHHLIPARVNSKEQQSLLSAQVLPARAPKGAKQPKKLRVTGNPEAVPSCQGPLDLWPEGANPLLPYPSHRQPRFSLLCPSSWHFLYHLYSQRKRRQCPTEHRWAYISQH
jgi:hypothetical protein